MCLAVWMIMAQFRLHNSLDESETEAILFTDNRGVGGEGAMLMEIMKMK